MDTWTFQDKSAWGDGPWQSEPDKAAWITATQYPGVALRHPSFGSWCGYIGVPQGHPLYRKSWKTKRFEALDAHVHVAVNFSGPCVRHRRLPPPEKWTREFKLAVGMPFYIPSLERKYADDIGLCHSSAGAGGKVWWIGFDLAHAFDYAPAQDALLNNLTGGKWDSMRSPSSKMMMQMLADLPDGDPLRPVYKTLAFCQARCEELATALIAMEE